MAARKDKKECNSKNTKTAPRQAKRRCDENKTIAASPKKLCYNPSSNSLEKRDEQFRKAIEKSKLKSLRVYPIDEDDEDDFRGFIKEDAENNSNRVKRAVASLESAQKVIAAKPAGADHSNICIPEPAPLNDGLDDPITKEDPGFPCDILYEVPDPVNKNSNIAYNKNAKVKKYYLSHRPISSTNLRMIYIVSKKTLKVMQRNGLTHSRVESLPF